MSLAAADGEDRARQLLALTDRLTQRLLDEVGAFEARRPHLVAGSAGETLRLANLYRHESARIRQEPDLLAAAPRELKGRLIVATERFQSTLKRHAEAVAAARVITEGLIHAVAQEVASRRSRGAGYGPSARAALGDASAITLNRRA